MAWLSPSARSVHQKAAHGPPWVREEVAPACGSARRNLKARAIIEHRDACECRGRAQPGEFAPFIDCAKCEGKAECTEVCPVHVPCPPRREGDGGAGHGYG